MTQFTKISFFSNLNGPALSEYCPATQFSHWLHIVEPGSVPPYLPTEHIGHGVHFDAPASLDFVPAAHFEHFGSFI